MIRRNTKQKTIVYDTVINNPGCHMSAEEIYNRIHGEHPNISKATVYRDLNVLAEEGLIRKVEEHSYLNEQHFDNRLEHHNHAVCSKCGKIVDVQLPEERNLEKNAISDEEGFILTSHEILFEGICRECRNKEC